MYVPKDYKWSDDEQIKSFIQANGFGLLVSQVEGKPWATHIPMVLEQKNGKDVLTGHLSKGNRQWKSFNGTEVLAIFQGVHAYISSSWYDHENAPTWNYQAVHVYGNIQLLDESELTNQLTNLVDKYEKESQCPVSVKTMSDHFIKREIKGIVGFELEITNIQAISKLSQNRDDKNYQSIVSELEKKDDTDSKKMADLMKLKRG